VRGEMNVKQESNSQYHDHGIFASFKQVFKNTQYNNTQNKVKRQLICGLIVLHQVCSPAHIRSSFWRAGFKMNYINRIPTINIQVQTWLTQRNSPNTNIKEESFIYESLKKKKRTRTIMKGETKKEKKEKKKSANKRQRIKKDQLVGRIIDMASPAEN
jgi:hypothetical protein